MSIIEKAAAKLDSMTSKEDSSIIENAANKIDSKQESAVISKITKSEDIVAGSQMPDTARKTSAKIKPKRFALNFEKLRHYGIITPEDKKTAITEQFRVIKRPLLKNSFNKGAGAIKNGNLIMVSSSLAGEGKSFCAVNLAMSIAMEMDHTVLLVDADVARPMIPKILGLGADKGLLDVLLDDKLDLTEVLIKTNIEKLSILTAGSPQPNAN